MSLPAKLFTLLICVGFVLVACSFSQSAQGETSVTTKPIVTPTETSQLKLPLKGPRIVVYKGKRELELYSDSIVVRTYRVGLGFSPVHDKEQEGDGRTPEGDFYIFVKNRASAYYLSLGLSYPNLEDAERGLRGGLITRRQYNQIVSANRRKTAPPQNTPLGGLIYIHGHGAQSDWTLGCVALENEHIRELFDVVPLGTPVTIKP